MTEASSHKNSLKPKVGISACLMGEPVRYDGGDKLQPLYQTELSPFLELTPFCPEVAAGLGTPRPPVQLVKVGNQTKALGVEKKELDVTQPLRQASKFFIEQQTPLNGFILKNRSPSCGLGSTPLFNQDRKPIGKSSGLFATAIRHHFPNIPIVDEAWLQNQWRCQLFITCCRLTLNSKARQVLKFALNKTTDQELFTTLLNMNQQSAERLIARYFE